MYNLFCSCTRINLYKQNVVIQQEGNIKNHFLPNSQENDWFLSVKQKILTVPLPSPYGGHADSPSQPLDPASQSLRGEEQEWFFPHLKPINLAKEATPKPDRAISIKPTPIGGMNSENRQVIGFRSTPPFQLWIC